MLVAEVDVSDVCCWNILYLSVQMDIPLFFFMAGPLSRPERPLSAARKNECEKDSELSVSAVVKAMQIENEALQRDLQRQSVSTNPQKVWQKKSA